MKVFTKFELQQMPAYGLLSRVLSHAELQFYYNTPPDQRAKKLSDLVLVRTERGRVGTIPTKEPITFPPMPTYEKPRTQKCLGNRDLFDRADRMAKEYMRKDFIYQGETFNMFTMGYRFEWNNDKSRFGVFKRRQRLIGMSKWMLLNSDATYEKWVDTMLHEIAHAIDFQKRGMSDHSRYWQNIALSIGCNGERCGHAKIDPTASKYTIVCPNGHKKASHKYSKKIAMGRQSCGKCSNRFDKRYILKQTRNY